MSIKDIDLQIENYSIREIKNLFKLEEDYTGDDIQRNVDKLFFTINKSDDLSMSEKKKMCHLYIVFCASFLYISSCIMVIFFFFSSLGVLVFCFSRYIISSYFS